MPEPDPRKSQAQSLARQIQEHIETHWVNPPDDEQILRLRALCAAVEKLGFFPRWDINIVIPQNGFSYKVEAVVRLEEKVAPRHDH